MENSDIEKIDEINTALKMIIDGEAPDKIFPSDSAHKSIQELVKNVNTLISKNDENLLENEETFRNFAKSSLAGIILIGARGNIRYWNQGAEDIFGYTKEEIVGKHFHKLFASEDRENLFFNKFPEFLIYGKGEALRKKHELTSLKKDNSKIPVEMNLSPVKISNETLTVAFIHDISERKEKEILEKKLFENQRLESIGTLASGIAHDFNNILGLVMGYTELAIVDVKKDSSLEKELKEIYKACQRAKLLVKQIMTYAMHSEEEFIPVQINLIAKEALKLLRTTIPKSIEFRLNIENTSNVTTDPTKIHQIFMNICTNAYQAMEGSNGILTVDLFNVIVKRDEIEELSPGKYLIIEISDNGSGIEKENINKIFDPYYTTKTFEKGTGLGLAVVLGIVKSCNGKIIVDSILGEGTTFRIYLPVTEIDPANEIAYDEKIDTGTESILIIDDDPALAKLCGEIAGSLGYKTCVYTSSIEAFTGFQKAPLKFDLVITDMNMPQMNGDILAEKIREIRDDIPVILCTGFSRIIAKSKNRNDKITYALKPLSRSELSSKIRYALDR